MGEQQIDNEVHGATPGDGPTVGPEDREQALREELATAQQQAEENQNKYLRARADMENYKKRIERTYADLAKSSQKHLLIKLLGVKDNLERALRYGENTGDGGEGVLDGVRLTEYQLNQLLEQEGVRRIETEGKPFDPKNEEAIQTLHDPTLPDHSVVQVVRQGYTFADEVLRPAQVIVNVQREDE